MQQIVTVWNALDIRRRIIVGLATVAVVAAILGLARIAATPNMALLYANLESGQAGEVVSALEQRGVAYEVRGNSIFVDSSKRDELRMTLASEGLPSNTTHGYELLDNLSGFGTTAQMFDAAYWRAKEGELARTIVSQRSISSARVHIATGGTNPFRRDIKPSASVTVTASGGNAITGKQARALKYLVASAVTGLSPEDVSVIDSQGNLVAGPEDGAAKVVDDRTETLRKRVQHLLEARVGPGNAVVEVSVDTVTRSETLRERKIDPESRVAISSDKQERTNSASDQASGVTVASNVPNGKAGDGQTTSSRKSETRERVNYEVSETEHKVTVPPGAIRRLTVAVLINGTTGAEPGGKQAPVSRNQKELDALRELVASAVGYDEARGDVITIRAMPFEQLEPAGTAAKQSFLSALNLDLMSIIQTLVLGAVALILGLFVIRPVLRQPHDERLPAPASNAVIEPAEQPDALTGEIDTGDVDLESLSLVRTDDDPVDDATLPSGIGQDVQLSDPSAAQSDPVHRLRALIDDRRVETVEILRSWLEGEEETVG